MSLKKSWMLGFISSLGVITRNVYDFLVVNPLKNLYFDGPTILGVGFWEKLPQKDICSRLTGVSATFWDKNDASIECEDLLIRKFDTFLVGLSTFSYMWIMYKIISFTIFKVFVITPIANELKQELKKLVQVQSVKCVQS
jgi:hypothetical protein